MKKETEHITLFGRKIPLTSKGLPNQRLLTKQEKEVLKKILAEKAKAKEEIIWKELSDLLKK